MGAFYGSIQVKTDDWERVRAAAEQVAKQFGIRCLVGPQINGWVATYPSNNGQDDKIGREMAKLLDDDVLQMIVHDDDIFAYWLYRNGAQEDSYWSRPGYFGENDRAAQETMAGRPDIVLGPDSPALSKLGKILQRSDEKVFMESERLDKFARLLGIANAVAAYEYLKAGERQGIRGWKKFVEVPEEGLEKEKQAKRDEAAANRQRKSEARRQNKRWKDECLLLLERDLGNNMSANCVAWRDEFLFWSHDYRTVGPVDRYQTSPFQPCGQMDFGIAEGIGTLVASRSDRYLAAGIWMPQSLFGEKGVWDVEQSEWLWRNQISGGPLGFRQHDEELILYDRDELKSVRVADGQQLLQIPISRRGKMAILHPTRPEVLVNEEIRLVVVDLARPEAKTEIFPGGKLARPKNWMLVTPDIEKLRAQARANLEQMFENLPVGTKDDARWVEHRAREIRRSEYNLNEIQSRIAAGKHWMPDQARLRVLYHVAFSRDGKWFFCGTTEGLLAYRWPDALNGADPQWKCSQRTIGRNGPGWLSAGAMVEDERRGEVVFISEDGRLFSLALSSGVATTLLKLPAEQKIFEMELSRDGRCLAMMWQVGANPSVRGFRRCWQVWDYERLRERAVTE